MNWWQRLRHQGSLERQLDAELRDHLQRLEADCIAAGMPVDEARRRARIEFGGLAQTKEVCREVRGLTFIDDLIRDLRYAIRSFSKQRGFAIVAVLSLALGIGANTAMFTVVDALLLRPAPFPDADRLANIFMGNEHGGNGMVAPSVLRAWRDSPVFEAVEGVTPTNAVLDTDGGPISRASAFVTPGLFNMLGVRPIRGQLFDATDGQGEGAVRVLISEELWRSVFDADPAAIGRTTRLNGEPVLVAGVLPKAFRFPEWKTEIWRSIDYDTQADTSNRPEVFLRIAKGVPEADALRVATEAAHAADPSTRQLSARRAPVSGPQFNDYARRAVTALAGGVELVFLVLCANVSSLLLARFSARRREFSLCSALGASRGRLLRQAFVESTLLGTLGVAAGLVLAWGLVSLARGLVPESFLASTLHPLDLDVRALAVAMASGAITVVAAGLLPAWMATRVGPGPSLSVIDRGGADTRSSRALTRILLVGEIALACTLLVGATQLVRSFINLTRVDLGFDPRGLTTVSMFPRVRDQESRVAALAAADEEIRHLPGVRQVAWTAGAPMNPNGLYFDYEWQSDTPGAAPVRLNAESYKVGQDFFDLYGIRLLKGRAFQPQDDDSHVIIGERLASALWPGVDPIGHSVTFGTTRLQVIGLAKETSRPVVDPYLDLPDLYEPFAPGGSNSTVTIRCGDACPSEGLIRQRLLAAAPTEDVFQVRRLEDAYLRDLAQPRATAALGFVFAAIALLAAAGGLFSVLSYTIARRRREFGIRRALGASPDVIRGLVLRDGLMVTLIGFGLGSVTAWSLAKILASLEYGVRLSDPLSWVVVFGVLGLTTLAACWRPAREATCIDPALLLREE